MKFAVEASRRIQAVYDDPNCPRLADRIEETLDLLDRRPGDSRVRRARTTDPPLWVVTIRGSGAEWVLLWDLDGDEPFVRYAGPDPR